jgi:hypothetical protein
LQDSEVVCQDGLPPWLDLSGDTLEAGRSIGAGKTRGLERIFGGEIADTKRAKMPEELIAFQLGDVVLLHR